MRVAEHLGHELSIDSVLYVVFISGECSYGGYYSQYKDI